MIANPEEAAEKFLKRVEIEFYAHKKYGSWNVPTTRLGEAIYFVFKRSEGGLVYDGIDIRTLEQSLSEQCFHIRIETPEEIHERVKEGMEKILSKYWKKSIFTRLEESLKRHPSPEEKRRYNFTVEICIGDIVIEE